MMSKSVYFNFGGNVSPKMLTVIGPMLKTFFGENLDYRLTRSRHKHILE